jgi:hypothetical protein
MKNIIKRFGVLGLALTILLVGGCILVSATFVVSEKFTVSPKTGFFFFQADVTDTDTWQDHSDEIDFIDAVGFIMYVRNTEPPAVDFSLYVDDYSGPAANPTSIPSSATLILEDLTIPPGESMVPYATSVKHIKDIDRLRELAKTGRFDCYTTSTGEDGTTFFVDSIFVVVTLSAG